MLLDGNNWRRRPSIPVSIAIMILLDNVGFSKVIFRQTDNNDWDEIRWFFTWKEDTVMNVLDEIARSAQCAMYIDNDGYLNVLSRQYVTKYNAINEISVDNNTGVQFSDEEWKQAHFFITDKPLSGDP